MKINFLSQNMCWQIIAFNNMSGHYLAVDEIHLKKNVSS